MSAPAIPWRPAIRLRLRSAAVLSLASVAGLVMFCWPLFVQVQDQSQELGPPFYLLLILPVVVFVVLAELSEGGMDAKVVAVLGVLSACNAVLRGLDAGTAGVEFVFFLLVLAGRVFGAGFGFTLGCTSLFASALLTGGVGGWLPYQMLASAWIGMGAGLLPKAVRGKQITGKAEIAMLVVYGVVVAYLFGLIMNLSGWPYLTGIAVPGHEGALSFVPADPLWENLRRFGAYTLITSTTSFDTGRAITNAVAIAVLGPPILTTLRRAARRTRVEVVTDVDQPEPRGLGTRPIGSRARSRAQ